MVKLHAVLWLFLLFAGCAGPLAHERAAIEEDLRPLGKGRVVSGRIWSSRGATVVEFAFVGEVPRPFGVIGAAVFDGHGRRIYLDRVTLRGQLDPSRIPKDLEVRGAVSAPLEGREHLVARGTPGETRNLAVANAVWAALDRHQPAEAMAPSVPEYRYEDYCAPKSQGRAETEQLVANFLGLIPDFVIAQKPVQFAAGDDVVTEMVEHGTFRARAITLHALDVKRFRDGKIVKEWQYSNYAEVLQQLFGVVVE
jgi:predicted SnoaL-like aldol condensation-catalyzing enzyme